MTGDRRALIIANGVYDNSGLSALRSPAADAGALAEVLSDRVISDFDVQVVRDETAHVIAGRVEDLFADSKPDDVLLLHFSCHGLKSESGELFFAARNTRPERLASTAVPADFVQRCMRMSRSRSIVLLLDCCYGGAFSQGVAVRATGEVNVLDAFPGGGSGGRGRAVITASNSIEYAFEGDHLADDHIRPSVFTSALVDGLKTGDADRDEDGWIALSELYDYLFDRVREQNPNQTPSRDIEMQGELYLAKSRRRKIRPSPIPADLQAASEDPNMFTRLGAVTELRRRLTSDNLPVAVGAYEVLTRMAQTDIQHVADAANTARREARVRAESDVLRFGDVVQGTRAVARIRLEGPPVARACRFESSHPWLRVTEAGGGAEVSVDREEIGEFDGRITVTGATGELVVAVEGTVIAEHQPEPEPAPAPEPVSAARPEHAPEPVPEIDLRREPPPPVTAKPPRPIAERSPEIKRVAEPAVTAEAVRIDPRTATAGVLDLVVGMGMVILLIGVAVSEDSLEEALEEGGWFYLLLGISAIGVGTTMLVRRTRALIGPGSQAGLAIMMWVPSGSSLVLLAQLVIVFVGVSVVWSTRRSHQLTFHRPSDALSVGIILLGLALGLGLIIPGGALSQSSRTEYEGVVLIVVGVALIAGTFLGVMARPRPFGLAILAGLLVGTVTWFVALIVSVSEGSSDSGSVSPARPSAAVLVARN